MLLFCSMAGKQVFEVPPANVGGSLCCLAVCVRGVDAKKVGNVYFDDQVVDYFFFWLLDLLL